MYLKYLEVYKQEEDEGECFGFDQVLRNDFREFCMCIEERFFGVIFRIFETKSLGVSRVILNSI